MALSNGVRLKNGLDQTQAQQAHLSDIMAAVQKKERDETMEWMENLAYERREANDDVSVDGFFAGTGRKRINNKRKFHVPTTYSDYHRYYTNGKRSIPSNVVRYTLLSGVLMTTTRTHH
jgi:hypothetical protein